jgi:hypothetical protein
MKSHILSLIISLCAEDTKCIDNAVLLEAKTTKQATFDVRAVKARNERLSNIGFNECGPYPGCFSAFSRTEMADFLFTCNRQGNDDCWKRWHESKEYKKISKEYDEREKKK